MLTAKKDRIEKMAVQVFRAVIVILAKDKTNGILAAQNMEFVAEAYGLGVLYNGYFSMAANVSRKIKKAIGVPKGKKAAMTLVLGYPNVRFLCSTPHKGFFINTLRTPVDSCDSNLCLANPAYSTKEI